MPNSPAARSPPTSTHLEQVAADLKTRLIFSTPGHPRGRGKIEHFFGTVNQMFLCSLPGYLDRGAVRGEPTLTLSDLDQRFHELLRKYHVRPHGETKVPPIERWCGRGFLPRMPESLEQLTDAGEQASWHYIDFFTANIRNPNTRRAYAWACQTFFAWCDEHGLGLRPDAYP